MGRRFLVKFYPPDPTIAGWRLAASAPESLPIDPLSGWFQPPFWFREPYCWAFAATMEIPAAYTIIAFDPACFWEAEFAGAQPAGLTTREIAQVEAVLAPAIAEVNSQTEQACAAYWAANPHSQFGRAQALIDLPRYARQYVALTTHAGEKLVWVQLLRHPHAEWRTQLRWVLDGGNAYINAIVSPAASELRQLLINGVA